MYVLQVLVHDPYVEPDVGELGFAASTGTEVLAAIRMTKVAKFSSYTK